MSDDTGYEVLLPRSRGRRRRRPYVEDFFGVPGHIYVARNDAHREGIYKIGLTTRRDPQTRINELNRQATEARVTGHIGHLTLVSSFETIDCGRAESAVHDRLDRYRYTSNREFFELPIEAIETVIEAVLDDIARTVRTTGKTPHQIAQEEAKREEAEQQARIAKERRRHAEEERQRRAEQEVRNRYEIKLNAHFPERPFWQYWLAGTALVFVALAMFGSESFIGAIFFGLFAGTWLSAHFEGGRKRSAEYKAIEAERDQEIQRIRAGESPNTRPASTQSSAAIRGVTVTHFTAADDATVDLRCPACDRELYIPRQLAQPGKIVSCPACAANFDFACTLDAGKAAPTVTQDFGKPFDITRLAEQTSDSGFTGNQLATIILGGVVGALVLAVVISFSLKQTTNDAATPTVATTSIDPEAAAAEQQQLQVIMEDAMRRWPYLRTPAGVEATREMIQRRDRWLELGLTPPQALRAAIEEVAPKHAK